MNAFVPNYQNDIFVSYAHVDNIPLPGSQDGWVSTLIDGLRIKLGQKLGRSDLFSLWKDDQLSPHKPFTPEIMDALAHSATLLIILSPGYMASPWCQREMQSYWQEIDKRNSAHSRIFVVERDKLEFDEKPKVLEQLDGYKFWIQGRESKAPRILGEPTVTGDILYNDKLADLALDLAKELHQLKEKAGKTIECPVARASESESKPDDRPAVFIAEVTDILDVQKRDQVSRYLDQEGFRVLPEKTTNYPAYRSASANLDEVIAADMKKCRLFVQLLSDEPGKINPGTLSFPAVQFRIALDLKMSVLQWRDPDLKTETIQPSEHRDLLEGDSVMAVGLEEFKQECVKQLRVIMQPPPPIKIGGFNMVYLCTYFADKELSDDIGRELKKMNIAFSLPAFSENKTLIEEEHVFCLTDSDGLIFVYGPSTCNWTGSQLRRSCRTIAMRKTPPKALAVYAGPPENNPDLGVGIPGMITLDGRKGFNAGSLQDFVAALAAG